MQPLQDWCCYIESLYPLPFYKPESVIRQSPDDRFGFTIVRRRL